MIVRYISPQYLHKSSLRSGLSSPRCPLSGAYCSSGGDASGCGWNRGCAAAREKGGMVGAAGGVRAACGGCGVVVARADRARRHARRARAGTTVLRGSAASQGAVRATGTKDAGQVRLRASSTRPHRHAAGARGGAAATIRRAQGARAIRATIGRDARGIVRRAGSSARFRLAPGRRASGGHAAGARRIRRAPRTQGASRTIRDRAGHREERAAAVQERACGHGLAGLAVLAGRYRYGSGLQVVRPKPALAPVKKG